MIPHRDPKDMTVTQTIRREPVAIVAAGVFAHLDTGETRVFGTPTPEMCPGWLLKSAAAVFAGQSEGVLMLERPFPAYAVEQLRGAGWEFKELSDTRFTSFRRAGTPTVHVGITGALTDPKRVPLISGDPGPAEFAARLGRYHRLMGVPWQGTAGMNGVAYIRDHLYTSGARGEQPFWHGGELRAKKGQPRVRGVDALKWAAPPAALAAEGWTWVHEFDTRAAYVAAAGVIELPWTKLKPTGAVPFDRAWPGYWLVPTHQLPELVVPLYDPRWAKDGAVWLTTETMTLLLELGYSPDIIDSWSTPMRRRLLKPWADQLRDALDVVERGPAADPVMRRAVKVTWAETVGMFDRSTARINRPDWREMIIDRCRANLTRKILAAVATGNLFPIRVNTDAVWYLSRSPLPVRVPGERPEVGRLQYRGSQSLSAYLEEHPHVD